MQELLSRIQQMQAGLTPSQRIIANYLLSSYASVPFRTISRIAEETGVSETTIFLFCKALGFSGFSEMKQHITDRINHAMPMPGRLAYSAVNTAGTDAVQEILHCDTENITQTLTAPDLTEALDQLLDRIDRAGKICTVGGRSSGFFAAFLAFKLRQQDLQVAHIDLGIGDYPDKMLMMQPGDLAIIFSFPRHTKTVVKLAELLRRRGVSIVLITTDALSPCYPFADQVLTCRTASTSYVASFSGCLSLLNAIVLKRALRHQERTEEWLTNLEQSLEAFDMFYGG